MFKLKSKFKPAGDQPQAIEKLWQGLKKGFREQTLLGVTGSGKTFTAANIISRCQRPTLVISHNKTLAAQLYSEFRQFFPENAVGYFVSYYDYYQPEAYIPQTDTYIEKDASINEEIDRLRLSATSNLMEREDVIIVASVSCIYGLGEPQEYERLYLHLRQGDSLGEDIIRRLVEIQYTRNDYEFRRGRFRIRGDTVEIFPAYEEQALRLKLFGQEIEKIEKIDPLTGHSLVSLKEVSIYPASHFVIGFNRLERAIHSIERELEEELAKLKAVNKLLEAQRLEMRTRYDLEMIRELGYCTGIENYSRHLSGRQAGKPPCTLLDYFPEDFLLIIDESHVTLPQLHGMYNGDRCRKETLVEHGFRLPSALDNRPLRFEEFEKKINKVIYDSATPGPYERERSRQIVEQIIRPTGLVDPKISVRPTKGQVDDLIREIRERVKKKERVLVTTLTKRTSEDLADYLKQQDIKVNYIHSDIETLKRVEIIRDLRLARFDCLVGINLLREGLDLPEVALVLVLDADKEGFLRSESSLIQMMGRAARNIAAQVIMYADEVTGSMARAIEETERRRQIQMAYNKRHGLTPRGIRKSVEDIIERGEEAGEWSEKVIREDRWGYATEKAFKIAEMEKEMLAAAERLDFEKAAVWRDKIKAMRGISKCSKEV
jgi:excinuclease ABC subunit B